MFTQEKPKRTPNSTHPGSGNFTEANFAQAKSKQTPLSPTQILRNFLTYASTALIIRGMTVLITPITMRVITPGDYGKMALLTSFAQVGSAIMGLGLRQVLALEYFHTPQEKRAELISTIIVVYSLTSIPLLFLAFMLRQQISCFVFAQAIPPYLVTASLLFIFVSFFSEMYYQVMRFEQEARKLTHLYLIIAIISTGATLFLLLYMRTGYASILYGQIGGVIMAIGYAISSGPHGYNKRAPEQPFYNFLSRPTHSRTTHNTQAKKNWRHFYAQIPSKTTVSRYLFLGLPFIPGMLCSWLLASGDRLMLARYGTLEQVGIYSIADSVCQLFTILVLQPWNSSYLPYILKKYTESSVHNCGKNACTITGNNSGPDTRVCDTHECGAQEKLVTQKLIIIERENQRLMWASMAMLAALIIAGLYLFKPLLLIFLSPAYHQALNYLFLLLMGSVFLYGAHCASTFIQFHKKSGFLASALALPASLNIILNYVLIPQYAIYGCVMATVISYVIYFLITLSYNRYLMRQYFK